MDLQQPEMADDSREGPSLSELLQNAKLNRFNTYGHIAELGSVKAELSDGPCMISINVWHKKNTGKMLPSFWRRPSSENASDFVTTGHAMAVVGYDDSSSVLIIRNSWGSTWGDGGDGHFLLPYSDWGSLQEFAPGSFQNFSVFWAEAR